MNRTLGLRAAVVLAAAGILLVPAIWNGSILYYWDSVDYVYLPFTFKLPIYRTMPYGLFAGVGRLAGTLWGVGVVQALLMSWVLHETLVVFASPGKAVRWLVPLCAILVPVTSLGWAVGRLMPDVFAGLMTLSLLTLMFDPHLLGRARRITLAVITTIAVAVHTSHFGLGVGLVVSIGAGCWLLRRRWPELKPRIRMAGCAVAASIPLVMGIHYATIGQPIMLQPSNVLWLARLVQDGLAKKTLDELCPTMALKLCPYKDKFPATANAFLWSQQAIPPRIVPNWQALDPEASLVIRESLRRFPLLHVWTAIKLTYEQFVSFQSGDGLSKNVSWLVSDTLQRYYPHDRLHFRWSRQRAGIDFEAINRVHVPVAGVAQALLPIIAFVAWRRRDRLAFAMTTGLMLALFGNAFICGALSNPNDRYQARLVWIAVMCCAVCIPRLHHAEVRPPQSLRQLS